MKALKKNTLYIFLRNCEASLSAWVLLVYGWQTPSSHIENSKINPPHQIFSKNVAMVCIIWLNIHSYKIIFYVNFNDEKDGTTNQKLATKKKTK